MVPRAGRAGKRRTRPFAPRPALCHPARMADATGMLAVLERWDALRARPAYRIAGVLAGILLAAAILTAEAPAGMSEAAQRTAAMTATMALWWVGGVLPMAVTALVPLVALPALGVAPTREAAAPYADPLIFLFLGGFVIAHAMEEVGLHRRLVAVLLGPAWVRVSPRRIALALMTAAAAVSSIINNTSAMLMMLPIALALSDGAGKRVRAAFVLSTAYACSIGGVATLVGTAPNMVFAGLAAKMTGEEIRFVDWLAVGVPFVVLAIPVAWFVVNTVALPVPARSEHVPAAPIRRPWGEGERAVLAVLVACLAGWLFRSPLDLGFVQIPGWGGIVPVKIDDGFVAIVAALVLFLLPRRQARTLASGRDDDGDEGRFLLSWRRTAKATPWSALLLLGGGFAMADAIQDSGLSAWLAGGTEGLARLPAPLAVLGVCVGVSFMSAFTSNTATTQIALPLLGAGATAAGLDPLVWMIPATISASCDFTLAVGTPPNAIAAETGDVAPSDMAFAGVMLNVACACIAALVALVIAPLVFG